MDHKEIGKITKVDRGDNGYYLTIKSNDSYSSGCFLADKYNSTSIEPKQGDELITYIINGSMVRGMRLNGILIYYKSDFQLEQERLEWLDNYKKEKEERFKKNKSKLDRSFKLLPEPFKKRIQRFRNENNNFRVDSESYEMFCCEQAVIIADTLKTPEEVERFRQLESWEEQKNIVPKLSNEHSGNTFGCACFMAYHYLLGHDL